MPDRDFSLPPKSPKRVPILDMNKKSYYVPKNYCDTLPTPPSLNPNKIYSDFSKTPRGIDFSKITGRKALRQVSVLTHLVLVPKIETVQAINY